MPADEVFEDSLFASLYDHFNGWDVCDDFYFGLACTLNNGARVLDLDGRPIPGLYAAGNVMASPFASTYGGAGGTLGPAMVWGYLAGKDLTGS